MVFHKIETTQYSSAAIDLPLSYISLTDWVLVRLQGVDIVQFAHNQFTCNIKKLSKNQYTLAAHCNPQGKMISNMYVFYFKNQKEIAFIQKKNVCDKQIKAMKKYAIFSQITITPDYNVQLVGIVGKNARQYLNIFFANVPNETYTIIHTSHTTLLYFNQPIERFLLITNNKLILHHLLNQSTFNIQVIHDNNQWTTLDIEAGYPWIELATSEMFIPQAVNMDILQGISFNKGCYIGQELIARIQYHGRNKRTLFRIINTASNIHIKNNFPKPGEHLKIKIKNKNEEYIGIVLQASQITEYNTWMQVILNKTILKHSQQKFIINTTQTEDTDILFL